MTKFDVFDLTLNVLIILAILVMAGLGFHTVYTYATMAAPCQQACGDRKSSVVVTKTGSFVTCRCQGPETSEEVPLPLED